MLVTHPAELDDVVELAAHMRHDDAEEVRAQTGREPLDVLVDGLLDSTEAWATRFGDELGAVWGVVLLRPSALTGDVGLAWMLTTDAIERHAKAFMRGVRHEMPRLLERWAMVTNVIDVRHVKAVRWAERLGFRLEAPLPFGPLGLPFRRFLLTSEDLCAHRWQ